MVSAEETLATGLYCQKIQQTYQDCFHFVGQCGPNGMAAYLPIQNMKSVLKSEVDPQIQALSAINKLTRVEGYNEIRPLSHSLQAIGWPLEKFQFPKGIALETPGRV